LSPENFLEVRRREKIRPKLGEYQALGPGPVGPNLAGILIMDWRMKNVIYISSLAILFSVLIFENTAFCEPPKWKQMTRHQRCREVLKIATVLGGISAVTWTISNGPDLYYRLQHRTHLIKEFQSPYENFAKEYRKVVRQDSRYVKLVEILFEEAKKSPSTFNFSENAQRRRADIEAIGLKLEDVQKLSMEFQQAFTDLVTKAYATGMSYDDLRWAVLHIFEQSKRDS
jgi:hypothetical protein